LEASGDNVLVQDLLKQVIHGHLVLLAAFFCGVSASGARDCDSNHRILVSVPASLSDAVEHRGNERPIPQSGHQEIESSSVLAPSWLQTGVLPFLITYLARELNAPGSMA
jgi:hypothetical protein